MNGPAQGPALVDSSPEGGGGLARALVDWQRRHGRQHLPWQATRDPYRVWVSEIMLQQTQVSTVLGYYDRFLQRFPTVQALAAAPLDDVLAHWSGLGYYSRARNLHRCAQQVVAAHGGVFPGASQALATLPGIGPSTAAAIAAFCFQERSAILDGNVRRVLSRVLGFADDLAEPRHTRALWLRAQELLPDRPDMPTYTQGLMDLGATVCLVRRPMCDACPWRDRCVARAQDRIADYPLKSRRIARQVLRQAVLWLGWRDQVWLQRRPPSGVWAGLWSLPVVDDLATAQATTAGWPGDGRALDTFKHVLTHRDWWLTPWHWRLPDDADGAHWAKALSTPGPDAAAARWVLRDEALALGLPAPVRRLLVSDAAA